MREAGERDSERLPDPPRDPAGHVRVPVKVEEALAALAMALICLISMGNVLARYLTNYSFAFTEEWSVFLLVFMTFVGASAAFATGSHIRITWFLERLPRPLRWGAELVTLLVTTALFALVVHYGLEVSFDEWYWGETTPGLGYPAWLYTIWLPVLGLAIIGRVLGRGWAQLRHGPERLPGDI